MNQIKLNETALIVVDVQNGFTFLCPNELPIPNILDIVPNINKLLSLNFQRIDATQDWHPYDHISFLTNLSKLGKWKPHCIQQSRGAEFFTLINTHKFQTIWRKGFAKNRDVYSFVSDHPGVIELYHAIGIKNVIICGIATNICVSETAKELRLDFQTIIVEDASAGIDILELKICQAVTKQENQKLYIEYCSTKDLLRRLV